MAVSKSGHVASSQPSEPGLHKFWRVHYVVSVIEEQVGGIGRQVPDPPCVNGGVITHLLSGQVVRSVSNDEQGGSDTDAVQTGFGETAYAS